MPHDANQRGWRRLFGEDVLSIFLPLVLLLGILFVLTYQTLQERDVAHDRALETTDFAITTYADHLSGILLKADSVAMVIANGISRKMVIHQIETQIADVIRNDRSLTGYVHLDANGDLQRSFSFDGLDHASIPAARIITRHRDSWIAPALSSSESFGLKPGHLAVERGIWSADGELMGVAIVFVQIANPYEDTPLEKFLSGAQVRVTSLGDKTLLKQQTSLKAYDLGWLGDQQETGFWKIQAGQNSLSANSTLQFEDLVLSKRSIPGLPATVYMQVPIDRFMENYWTTRRSAIAASAVIVALTLFLFLQIAKDRRLKHLHDIRREEIDKRLQFSLDATGQGLWDWNFKAQSGFFSPNLFGLLSMPHGEVDLSFASFRDQIHADDRDKFDTALDEHIVGTKPVFETEVRMRRHSEDDWVWFSHSGSVVEWDKDKKPKRMIGLIKNVHARKLQQLELEYEASHDPLTGLLNRAAFDDRAARLHAQASRTGTPLTAIMLDLDHFKRVNDTYGHHCGDVVLREFADLVTSVLRFEEEKLFFRLGGEEFVILLPQSPYEAGLTLAERIRANMEKAVIETSGHKISVTVSLGVAELVEGETINNTLHRADLALYAAKEQGRNQVHLAPGHAKAVA